MDSIPTPEELKKVKKIYCSKGGSDPSEEPEPQKKKTLRLNIQKQSFPDCKKVASTKGVEQTLQKINDQFLKIKCNRM